MKEEIDRLKDEEKEKLYPEPVVVTKEDIDVANKQKRKNARAEQDRRERLAADRGFEFETAAPAPENNRFGWVGWLLLGIFATLFLSGVIGASIPFWSLFLLVPGLMKLDSSWKTRQAYGEFDRKARKEWNNGISLFSLGLFFSVGATLGLPFIAFLIVWLGAIFVSDRRL